MSQEGHHDGIKTLKPIPFLCTIVATTSTEQKNNMAAEKEPRTRGQSRADTSAHRRQADKHVVRQL